MFRNWTFPWVVPTLTYLEIRLFLRRTKSHLELRITHQKHTFSMSMFASWRRGTLYSGVDGSKRSRTIYTLSADIQMMMMIMTRTNVNLRNQRNRPQCAIGRVHRQVPIIRKWGRHIHLGSVMKQWHDIIDGGLRSRRPKSINMFLYFPCANI